MSLTSVTSSNTELGAKTNMEIKFSTQSPIPQNSILHVTLPVNIIIDAADATMTINDVAVSSTITAEAKQFVINGLPVDNTKDFTVKIEGGLTNPQLGPYNYEHL